MQTWQQNITNTVPASAGCFQASYPSTQWQAVACVQTQLANAPVSLPSQTNGGSTSANAPGGGAAAVGNGTDYAAIVAPGSFIASAVGSFVNVTGVSSIDSIYGTATNRSNQYSLQINTNKFVFTDSTLCKTSTGTCSGWEQFVYSNDSSTQGALHIQYWILSGGAGVGSSNIASASQCPAGWQGYTGSSGFSGCYTDSAVTPGVVPIPAIAPSNLGNVALIGKTSSATDTVIININGQAYATVKSSIFKALPQVWTNAEFNIFGHDSTVPTAAFNNGASMAVKTAVNNGTTNAPICSDQYGGTTYEGSNLNFNSPCCPYDGANPAVVFTEGTSLGTTAACPALNGGTAPSTYTVSSVATPSNVATFTPPSTSVARGVTLLFTMNMPQRTGYTMSAGYSLGNGTVCPLTDLGWNGNNYQYKLGPITGNCTLAATFSQATYTVSASASPSNLATFSPASTQVAAGGSVTFSMTMPQRAGYTMSAGYSAGNGTVCPFTDLGWSGNVYQFRIGPVSGNCSLAATFSQATYTVSASASPSDTAMFSPSSVQAALGATVTFTMTQKAGYGLGQVLFANGTNCPVTSLGGSGDVWKFALGPITGNCSVVVISIWSTDPSSEITKQTRPACTALPDGVID